MDDRPVDSRHAPHVRYLIVGAGPAGLQLAYFLDRSGADYLILEAAGIPGAFFRTYPRSRQLISFNKIHSVHEDPEIRLRWDWNSLLTEDGCFPFERYSRRLYPTADEMVRYLADFAEQHGLKVIYRCPVRKVSRIPAGGFLVMTESGCYTCDVLIVATGVSRSYIPPIPGIEHCEGYESVALEADGFEGQRVLIIGKGNSGFEVADAVLDSAALVHMASPHPVHFAWRSRHPGHVRGQYSRILDMYHLKTLNGALDCVIKRIDRDGAEFIVSVAYVHADGEEEELVYDRVVRCTGFCFNSDLFDGDCRPELTLDGRFPAMTPEWESVNVPDLFFAGTLMQARDFKRASSAFIDGFRYNIRTLHTLLRARPDRPRPARSFPATPEALEQAVLHRVSRSSGLWAQFGYLCDVLVVDERAEQILHYEELPVEYVRGGPLGREPHHYTITFEWGSWEGDVFAIQRHPRANKAFTNVFLHPIVRRFEGARQREEHHILEDLFGIYSFERESGAVRRRSGRDMHRYHLEEHNLPLRQFFSCQLNQPPVPARTQRAGSG